MTTEINVTPLHDRVVVEPIEVEATSKGGIIIPDTAKEKPQRGNIIAVGPGRTEDHILDKKLSFIIRLLLWICTGIAKLTGFKLMKEDPPTLHAMTVKAGDTVLFSKHAGSEIQIEDKRYLIMRESDILAII